MPRPPLPSDEFLRAMLRDALRRYEAALPTASPIQKFVWREVGRGVFIGHWPYDCPSPHVADVVSCAMHRHLFRGWALEDALKEARRVMR